ncbi:MAG: hypothetical protein DRJ63_04930 [Thermoprotei archaeon]|nr:MAG: hypothetical protein DRJ63_04930 [Thermoprotei archaeon]
MRRRVFVTGAGGVGGVNFTRALRVSPIEFFIVGSDYNPYYINFPFCDVVYRQPRHDSPEYIPFVVSTVKKHDIEFLHPQPEVDAETIAYNREKILCKTLLPPKETFRTGRDKYFTYLALRELGIVPETKLLSETSDAELEEMLAKHGKLWIRARKGAGGRLSLPVSSIEELRTWVKLWKLRLGVGEDTFIVQEYLPGRDLAWDSLWYKGKLVASFTRERLRYIFPHLSPSRVTGTPTVAKIIVEPKVNEVCIKAVKAIDPKATGFFCIDLKEDSRGEVKVTEVNIKAHTTLALWSYIAVKALNLDWRHNLSYTYVALGLNLVDYGEVHLGTDILPEETVLIRHIDCGLVLLRNGERKRIPLYV